MIMLGGAAPDAGVRPPPTEAKGAGHDHERDAAPVGVSCSDWTCSRTMNLIRGSAVGLGVPPSGGSSRVNAELQTVGSWGGESARQEINRAQVIPFIARRQAAGMSGRTVNLGRDCLRNALKRGLDDGWLNTLPAQNMRPLGMDCQETRSRHGCGNRGSGRGGVQTDAGRLARDEERPRICRLHRLMAGCGARRNEALRCRWLDVDRTQGWLTIGADGLTKNHAARVVDMNAALERRLKARLIPPARRTRNSCFRVRRAGTGTAVPGASRNPSGSRGKKPGCRLSLSTTADTTSSAGV